MKIVFNYREETINKKLLSVKEFLKLKDVKMPHMIAVQLNAKIVKKTDYKSTFIKESDKINLLYFVSGG